MSICHRSEIQLDESKLFRNVPSITHERMSPWLFVFRFLRLALRDIGRPERSDGRPESRSASRAARPWAFIPFQNVRPAPTPSRRHGWFCAGGFTDLGFGAGTDFLAAPAGSRRHWSCWPRYPNCTRPFRSVRTTTLRRTRLRASCCRSN